MADSVANLQDVHNFLLELAHEAGGMIRAAKPSTLTSGCKKNTVDLVTETDQEVEKMVSTRLRDRYPDYAFLGEETYEPGMQLGPGPTFVVDPVDGTVNFVHGHSYVSISLAFCLDRRAVVGVVYNPFADTLYSAIKGQGSYLNRQTRLPLKSPPQPLTDGLRGALVAVEWGSDRSGNNWDVKINTFRNLGEQGKGMVHALRSLGSAALNFCNVASGAIDIYWEAGCWAWDVAAGWLILEEAGGLVVDANPGGWRPAVDGRRYMAVRAAEGGVESQRKVVEDFWSLVAGRFEYDE